MAPASSSDNPLDGLSREELIRAFAEFALTATDLENTKTVTPEKITEITDILLNAEIGQKNMTALAQSIRIHLFRITIRHDAIAGAINFLGTDSLDSKFSQSVLDTRMDVKTIAEERLRILLDFCSRLNIETVVPQMRPTTLVAFADLKPGKPN